MAYLDLWHSSGGGWRSTGADYATLQEALDRLSAEGWRLGWVLDPTRLILYREEKGS